MYVIDALQTTIHIYRVVQEAAVVAEKKKYPYNLYMKNGHKVNDDILKSLPEDHQKSVCK